MEYIFDAHKLVGVVMILVLFAITLSCGISKPEESKIEKYAVHAPSLSWKTRTNSFEIQGPVLRFKRADNGKEIVVSGDWSIEEL